MSTPINVHFHGGSKDGEILAIPYDELVALRGRITFHSPPLTTVSLDARDVRLSVRRDTETYELRGRPIIGDGAGDVYADCKGGGP